VAQLSHQADAVLSSLGGILAPFGNPLRIEGYTDDKPINTAVFPSNWELSAARAASVARLFTEHGVSPSRLGIIGWGQFRPAADNVTVEGRNRNRRVLVVVLSDHATPTRYSGDADRLGQLADVAPPSDAPATPVPPGAGLAKAGATEGTPKAAVHVVEPPLIVTPGHGK
jgi:chemotaxis protein MotB